MIATLSCFGTLYDAAGRLVREGSKTYRYGYLDKVMSVTDNGSTYTYEYHADGQLASATVGGDQWYPPAEGCPRSGCTSRGAPRNAPQSEDFLWDGLALIQRGDEQFINEPHIGGGNPVASSKGTSYFNDALGTTVGSKQGGQYSAAVLTAFGESLEATSNFKHQTSNSQTFFTGKPYVEGLGHAFWMRNYRAGLAKWQTADPMGYPDGWNQLAYCGNGVTGAVDLWGCVIYYTKSVMESANIALGNAFKDVEDPPIKAVFKDGRILSLSDYRVSKQFKNLQITAHGASDRAEEPNGDRDQVAIQMGNKYLFEDESIRQISGFFGGLKAKFCKKCEITLYSCYLGQSPWLGDRIRKETGCTVKLFKWSVNPFFGTDAIDRVLHEQSQSPRVPTVGMPGLLPTHF